MTYKFGLKLASKDIQYTKDIFSLYEHNMFEYIELFALSNTYNETISYWKQFSIPFVIHAPHSAAGMNLAQKENRNQNKEKIYEVLKFADTLKADYIIFHSGTNGTCKEVVEQLKPFSDERFLIENKPLKGLDGSVCVGTNYEQLYKIITSLNCGFVLDFGHAICAARSYKIEPINFIKQLMVLKPKMFHLTDGDYNSELDSHLHYGKGTFPLKQLLAFVPSESRITNEAKRENKNTLKEIETDFKNIQREIYE